MSDMKYYVVRGASLCAGAFVVYKLGANYSDYFDIYIPSRIDSKVTQSSKSIDFRFDVGLRMSPENTVDPVTYDIGKDLKRLKSLYPMRYKPLLKRNKIQTVFAHRFESDYVKDNSFKVLQFNILADGLSGAYWPGGMEDAKSFVGIDKQCLEWRYRGLRIIEEIMRSEADIVCIQECDRIEFIDKYLSKLGFKYVYQAKKVSPAVRKVMPKLNRAREKARKLAYMANHKDTASNKTEEKEDSDYKDNENDIELHNDGCAVFYKASKFEVIDDGVSKVQRIENYENRVNIAAVAVPLKQLSNSKRLLVVTTHLKSTKNNDGEMTRKKQIDALFKVEQVVNGKISYKLPLIENKDNLPILLCLDMNATHKFEAYEPLCYDAITKEHHFISLFKDARTPGKALEPEAEEKQKEQDSSNVRERGVRGSEPEYTTFKSRSTGTVKHTIDYVFEGHCSVDGVNKSCSEGVWSVTEYLDIPETDAVIPDWFYPSDHFSLCMQLTWNANSDQSKKDGN